MPEIQSQWSVCAALATFRDDVRAENRIHGSDQQSCSLDVLRVMITITKEFESSSTLIL
jgi:hypothetical protein